VNGAQGLGQQFYCVSPMLIRYFCEKQSETAVVDAADSLFD
jgi:hypothetical protein